MFLTEDQARANIKELVAFDALKLVSLKQEKRIENLNNMIKAYEKVLKDKDSIISEMNGILDIQEDIIKSKKPLELHGYIGSEIFELNYNEPILFSKIALEGKKFNFGARGNFRPTTPYNLPLVDFNLYVELKIF